MKYYSYSKIKCFQNCPLCFKYQYIEKIEIPEFETIEAFMGSKVHEALDLFYCEAKKKKLLDLDGLVDIYNDRWIKDINPGIVVNKKEMSHEDYRMKGLKCLKDYYEHHKPFDETEILATEMRIDIDLCSDGRYRLMGYIDRLDKHPSGVIEIHDYKTSSRLPDQSQNGFDEQLALYEIGVRQRMDEVSDIDLIWHYLIHDRDIKVRKSLAELDDLSKRFTGMIQDIEYAIAMDEFQKTESRLCGWCAYQDICCKDKKNKRISQSTISSFFDDG